MASPAPDLFNTQDYKAHLLARIAHASQETTGYKARLARAAQAPQALISQVLHGKTHLSLDHALRLARFWHLTDDETEQWLELVQLARASSKELQQHLKNRLQSRARKHQDIAARLAQPRVGNADEEWEYYTQWMLQTCHMLVTIPRYQTAQAIASALYLPTPLVQAQLERLVQLGMIAGPTEQGAYTTTQKRVHLPKSSRATPINQWAWRQKAMERAHEGRETDLYYSTLHTLSEEDARRIRTLLLEAIERASKIVAPSPEETLVGINIDYFKLV